MKRIMSLVICLALMLCCAGIAESGKLTVSMNGTPVAGFTAYHDTAEDGCETRSFSAYCMDEKYSAVLQCGKDGITFGADGEYYTLTAEAVAELIVAAYDGIVEGIRNTDPAPLFEKMAALITEAKAYAADVPALLTAGLTEAVRAAEIAQETGIVNVNAAGDVTVAVTSRMLREFAVRFLNGLAENSGSIDLLAGTKVWADSNLPDAETVTAMIKTIAEELEAEEAEEAPFSCIITFRADGSFYAEINGEEDGESVSAVIDMRGNDATVRVSRNGSTTTVFVTGEESELGGYVTASVYRDGELAEVFTAGLLADDENMTAYVNDGNETAILTATSGENGFCLSIDMISAEGEDLGNFLTIEYGEAEIPAHEHITGTPVTITGNN